MSTAREADLEQAVEEVFAAGEGISREEGRAVVARLIESLEDGSVRAAECRGGEWHANEWVKRGILLAFRWGDVEPFQSAGPLHFNDKDTLPTRVPASGVRVVPGGSAIRAGAHMAPGVVVMPPAYVNVGAYVGRDSMIDSHALVGSCAQVGERVHLSAAAQVGGVLEPVGELPVILENDVLVGGNCGLYEGVLVRERAVIGAGVILTRSTPVYDCVNEIVYRAGTNGVLKIPAGAVVVSGTRPAAGKFAAENGLQIATPLIVKYRDAKTDARVALEGALR